MPFFLTGQLIEGRWNYEVLNTVSGDYTGELNLHKDQSSYTGEIVSDGKEYQIEIKSQHGDSILILAEVEGFLLTIKGKFAKNILSGNLEVLGDSNIYEFSAVQVVEKKILKVIDLESHHPIPYATIEYGDQGTISNEYGLCQITMRTDFEKIIISSIGYIADTANISSDREIQIVQLAPIDYKLPTAVIKATSFPAKKIVIAAINHLSTNYIQQAYNANLFFRYSVLNKNDSLLYQSESMLNYYDSKGYKKAGWKKVTGTRYGQVDQYRITHGEKKKNLTLNELIRLPVFWAHEPIVADDRALSTNGIDGFEFKLVGVRQYKGSRIFEIEFNATNLKYKYTGLSSLQYMRGRLYITEKDYAIIKYEENSLIDFTHKGNAPKKRGNLKERNIHESSKIHLYANDDKGYRLDYAKVNTKVRLEITSLDGDLNTSDSRITEEYQYFNLRTENVEPLDQNLFSMTNEAEYDQSYWDQFNLVIRSEKDN